MIERTGKRSVITGAISAEETIGIALALESAWAAA